MLLVADVEALAPRETPGPLATVFRQVLGRGGAAPGVAVVCTTSRPEAVDPALRAPGLLATELSVPLPDAALRREQLDRADPRAAARRRTCGWTRSPARTPGFVAADLAALAREAGGTGGACGRSRPDADGVDGRLRRRAGGGPADLDGRVHTGPCPDLTLDDVGDMAEVKQTLTESVLWPLTYPDTFARLGVQPPRGVLLYGPPGCGKTYLVKALAGTGQANVLSVKGAELLSKWVGESERAVRELFRRAREAAPTLVFLDEVDALAPVRGQATDGGTTDRVVAALLTELDGVEALRNVVVVGATNRPDLVDPALLRPGRLERLVYVPPPDADARAEILRAAARRAARRRRRPGRARRRSWTGSRPPTARRWSGRRRWPRCGESLDAATVTADARGGGPARGSARPWTRPRSPGWPRTPPAASRPDRSGQAAVSSRRVPTLFATNARRHPVGQLVHPAPAGAVGGHDQIRRQLTERLHRRPDHRLEQRAGEVEPPSTACTRSTPVSARA